MVKERVSEEEFDRIAREEHHAAMLKSLTQIAEASNTVKLEAAVTKLGSVVQVLTEEVKRAGQKDTTIDTSALANALKEVKQVLQNRPKSYRVERNKAGLIERVVVEST